MINYEILNKSILHYEDCGFKRIETPWLVTEQVSNYTKPDPNIQDYKVEHNQKVLVASGEQSFLYLYLKDFLPPGRFQTITPCFRSESFDFLHSKYFMKNELIDTHNVSKINLMKIIDCALSFFQQWIPEAKVVPMEAGKYDIMWGEYELGSYGIRSNEFLKWVYGTGVAEPRFSRLIKLYEDGLS